MRKLLSVVLALALLLACAALPAAAEGASYAGEWYLVEMGMNGMSMAPGDVGMSMTLTLNEDGTGRFLTVQGGEEKTDEVTWEAVEGGINVTQSGDTRLFEDVDGRLKAAIGESTLILGREAPAAMVIPSKVTAESLDVFQGKWQLTKMLMGGALLPSNVLANMGMTFESNLAVEGEKAFLDMTVMGISVTGEAPVEGTAALTEGALVVTIPGTENTTFTFWMTDTGDLLCDLVIPNFESSIPLFYSPAQEAAE